MTSEHTIGMGIQHVCTEAGDEWFVVPDISPDASAMERLEHGMRMDLVRELLTSRLCVQVARSSGARAAGSRYRAGEQTWRLRR